MGLVDNNVLPLKFKERRHANSDAFEGGYNNVEIPRFNLSFNNFFPHFFDSYQVHDFNLGTPPLELLHPVADHRLRHYNQVVPVYFFEFSQEAEERDGLNGLAEAHFVGQNAIDSDFVETYHPVEAVDLVVAESAIATENRRLSSETSESWSIFIL